MSLFRLDVLDYIDRVRANPVLGTDPAMLNELEKRARANWDGSFGALNAPIAPFTWEQRAILLAADSQSERINFRLPFAVEIVGIKPTLCDLEPSSDNALPTANDIDIALDINSSEYLTTTNGVSTAAGGRGGVFVTLSTIDVQAPRLFGLRLQYANPDLGFQFRWKNFNADTPVYRNTLIGVALYCRNISPITSTGLGRFTAGQER